MNAGEKAKLMAAEMRGAGRSQPLVTSSLAEQAKPDLMRPGIVL